MRGVRPGVLLICILLALSLPASGQLIDETWPVSQDDAGSGSDAPDTPEASVPIEPGTVYTGTLGGGPLTGDSSDHYAFTGDEGDLVQATARGLWGCYAITNDQGEVLQEATTCTLAGWDAAFGSYDGLLQEPTENSPIEASLEQSGTHYLVFSSGITQEYRFTLTIDESGIEPGYFAQPLPPPGPAPACHEVFADHLCDLWADLHKICEPLLADWICKTLSDPDRSDPRPLQQDDAGSGQDAPDGPVSEVPIEPGAVYEGTLAGIGTDRVDHYTFTGQAGDTVLVKLRGIFAFYRILDSEGEPIDKNLRASVVGRDAVFQDGDPTGLFFGPTYLKVTLETDGTHFLMVEGFTPQQYRFVLTLNEPAPEPGWMGEALPPLPSP